MIGNDHPLTIYFSKQQSEIAFKIANASLQMPFSNHMKIFGGKLIYSY